LSSAQRLVVSSSRRMSVFQCACRLTDITRRRSMSCAIHRHISVTPFTKLEFHSTVWIYGLLHFPLIRYHCC
jgi:hypothetical protein